MLNLDKHPIYVSGVAESPLGHLPKHTELSMVALAARDALKEAGLTLADVDGVFSFRMGDMSAVQLSEYLDLKPKYVESSDLQGSAPLSFVHHAIGALSAGLCDVALIAFAAKGRTGHPDYGTYNPMSFNAQFEEPYGLPVPLGHYAMAATRHMHEFGTTSEQLAEVAVAARQWAALNPKAWKRSPITVDDVLESRMICSPIRRLDCCVVTDAGGAVVLTRADRARDAVKKPVRVLGAGESVSHVSLSQAGDLARPRVGREAAKRALEMSGVGLDSIDFAQIYDAFTISVLLGLEDIGFCKPGESGAFVEKGALAPGGRLATFTSGGGLSYTHPGAFGIFLIIEAVRQLRGEAGQRQVSNARVGMAHAIAGTMSCGATIVLGKE